MGATNLRSAISARCREAADRPGALWAQAGCLAGGGWLAWLAARGFAWSGDDLDQANRLGIISATTLAGYAKSRDTHAYEIALAIGVLGATALWWAWCVASSRGARAGTVHDAPATAGVGPGWRWSELALVALVLVPGLLRFDLAVNGWDAPYTFYSEEGEALAWADVALHGGALSADTYCLYGPLATYPIAAAFAWLGPSVVLWRLCLYLMDLPALLAAYLLLRELGRSRLTAWSGVALVCFHRMWPMPGMSWSLLRTGLGLAAIAAVANFLRTGRRRSLIACGIALGAGVFFSQEAGVAAAVAVAAALACDAIGRGTGVRAALRQAGSIAAGLGVVAVPVIGLYAARGALTPMIANLFGFAKLRVLGHGGQPFPSLPGAVAAWLAQPGDALRDALCETIAAYFAPVLYAFAAFRLGTRWLSARYARDAAAHAALVVYGSVLFVSPLTRPDATHVLFAMPPAFVLVVDLSARALRTVRRQRAPFRLRSAAASFVVVAIAGLATFGTDTLDNFGLFVRQVGLNLTGRRIAAAEEGFSALDLARGGGVRVPADRAVEIEAVVRYVRERTRVDEPLWAFPNEPMINFLADRPLANRYPLALFAITRAQRLELIQGVARSGARYAIVNTKPTMVDAIPSREQVPELWSYLESNFVLERSFGRFDVMRRVSAEPPH